MSSKYITSHKYRVKRVKYAMEREHESWSLLEREARVEFYLLEDIIALYEDRLKKEIEKSKNIETKAGEIVIKSNIAKFSAIVNIFKSAADIARGAIAGDNASIVRKAIPERSLMKNASKIKKIGKLKTIAIKLLRDLNDESIDIEMEQKYFDEMIDDLDTHRENVRKVKDLPSTSTIDELINAVEVAIPDKKKNKSNLI